MNTMKEHIKSCKISADLQEGQIVVAFKVDQFLFEQAMNVIERQLQTMYVPLPVCGGNIDWDENWGWVAFDDFLLGVWKGNDTEVRLLFPLVPETTEEWLDQDHPHFDEPRPSIWIDAAAAFKKVFFH